ncbi:hypothetical protein FALBO_7274 [Fusarium albosuccineum]|uniref:Thioesterase domain-containing protein n=1 Tax=Fusarium albosuccineum TaxID=1237068 RepID=A0A8H4LBN0_9HYPO|nr:hypothetical protein FALBO_7274 [Fusarium albosuccineum]
MSSNTPAGSRLLAKSAYNSPLSRIGANNDSYAALRASALETLTGMGFDPETMIEHGVAWADDQDPFGHVKQSKYMEFVGTCLHRVTESYAKYLSKEEYTAMITGKGVIPVLKKYETDIRRQVKYPDTIIVGFRMDGLEPDRSVGTAVLYSLTQQATVVVVKGFSVYVDTRTGRPVDLRTTGPGFKVMFDALTEQVKITKEMREAWIEKHPNAKSKI